MLLISICNFRTSKVRTHLGKSEILENKSKDINDNQAEKLYEDKILKFMEEDAGKSFRLLLPVKTQMGKVEKRLLPRDNNITEEKDDKITNDNEQKQNEEDNQEDISDMEIDMDTHVRPNVLNIYNKHKINLLNLCFHRTMCKKRLISRQFLLWNFWQLAKNCYSLHVLK